MKLQVLFFLVATIVSPLALGQAVSSRLNQSQEFMAERERLEGLIEAIESSSGPYDPALLEPLEGMAELYQGIGDFEIVDSLLSRQLQLMRTELGLDHPDNILLVRQIIENKLKQEQWDKVAENLEHIRYLESANQQDNPDKLVAAITEQARWSLLQVHVDDPSERAKHLLDAREFYEDAEKILEKHYGEDHEKLIPIYYQQALTLYQLVSFLNSDGSLGGETVRRVIREDGPVKLSSVNSTLSPAFQPFRFGDNRNNIVATRNGEVIGEAYLRNALSKMDDIRDILEDAGRLEAAAMAELYYADFQLLLGRGGIKQYRKAREALLEQGVTASQLELYLSIPEVLPAEHLDLSFAGAFARRQEALVKASEVSDAVLFLGEFSSLEESADRVRMPYYAQDYGIGEPSYSATVSLRVSSRGKTSSVRVEEFNSDENRAKRIPVEAVRGLVFRPRIVEGKAERIKEASLRYQFSKSSSR